MKQRKTKVTDVPLPSSTFEEIAQLDVNAVFPGDTGPPLKLKTLELTNPADLDDLELLLVDARARLLKAETERIPESVLDSLRPLLDSLPMDRLESALDHADETGTEAVRGAFNDGGSLLTIWKPSDPVELAEMQAQVKMATRLMAGVPDLYPQLLAAKVVELLGDLERRGFSDQTFQNTLLSYNFGKVAPWVPRPNPNDCEVGETDPNEPKILHQGTREHRNIFEGWKPAVPPIVPVAPKPISILEQAQAVVHGPRRDAYGHPTPNHRRIADLWSAYIAGKYDVKIELTPIDAVLMMEQVKIARLMQTPDHRDSWTDMAGYAACGAIISGVDDA